jgi:hypothetical protein
VLKKEDYLPKFENQFNLFALENIGFDNFPLGKNAYGDSNECRWFCFAFG